MPSYNDGELILHLLSRSKRGLGSFMLSRMNIDANLRKELVEKVEPLLEKIIENRVEMRWATAIRDHGEMIVEHLSGGRHEPAQPYPPRKIAERVERNRLPKVSDP